MTDHFSASTDRAAAFLADLRRDRGIAVSPLPDAPDGPTAAYRIQRRLHDLLVPSHGAHAGWKIGAASAVAQKMLGVDAPCFGRLRAADMNGNGASFALSEFRAPGVECEIAVRLGCDLPARNAPYIRDETDAAIAAVMPAIEVVDNRFQGVAGVNAWTMAADDFSAGAAVLGTAILPDGLGNPAEMTGTLSIDGAPVGSGPGAAVLGHPFAALNWLANTLPAHGMSLAEGDVILLGSVIAPVWLEGPCEVTVAFDGLGGVGARFR